MPFAPYKVQGKDKVFVFELQPLFPFIVDCVKCK